MNSLQRIFRRFAPRCTAAALAGAASLADADTVPPRPGARELAEAIRLPEWRTEGSTVAEALDQLQGVAQQADPRGRELRLAILEAGGADVPRITLNLRNVTLWDALRYTAMAAGLHLRVDENAIVLSRHAPAEGRLITRVYPVMPAVLDRAREESRIRAPAR